MNSKEEQKIICDYINDPKRKTEHIQPYFFCLICNEILCFKCYGIHFSNKKINHDDGSIVPYIGLNKYNSELLNHLDKLNKKIEEDKKKFNQKIENIVQNVNNKTDSLILKFNELKEKIITLVLGKKKLYDYDSESIYEFFKKFDCNDFSKENMIKLGKNKNFIDSIEKRNKVIVSIKNNYLENFEKIWKETMEKFEKIFTEQKIVLNNYIEENSNDCPLLNNKNILNERDDFTALIPNKKPKIEEIKNVEYEKAIPKKHCFSNKNSPKVKNISKLVPNENKAQNNDIFNNNNGNLLNNNNNNNNNLNYKILINNNNTLNNNNEMKYYFTVIIVENEFGKIIIYNMKTNKKKIYPITNDFFIDKKSYKYFPFPCSKGVNTKNTFYLTGGIYENEMKNLTFKITFNEKLKQPEIETYIPMNSPRINHNIIYLESKNTIIVSSGKSSVTCEGININNNSKNWFLLPNINNVRMNGTFFSIQDKYIYLIGGYNSQFEEYVNGYEFFDFDENLKWDLINLDNINFRISTMGVINFNDFKVIFVGGHNGKYSYSRNIFNITFNKNQICNYEVIDNKLEKGTIFYQEQTFKKINNKFIGFDIHGNLVEYDVEKNDFTINKQ